MAIQQPEQFYGTGRRKAAVARVFLRPGEGKIIVNGKEFQTYFRGLLRAVHALQAFRETGTAGRYDAVITVTGGGPTGQAGALRLAIARALNVYNPAERPTLKKAGLLTRDARAVERKKAGLHKARRAPQYSKR